MATFLVSGLALALALASNSALAESRPPRLVADVPSRSSGFRVLGPARPPARPCSLVFLRPFSIFRSSREGLLQLGLAAASKQQLADGSWTIGSNPEAEHDVGCDLQTGRVPHGC